jgi:hypothetical protein
MQALDKAFVGTPKTFYCEEIENYPRSNPSRFVTVNKTGKLFSKYKRSAMGETAANGSLATGLSVCDMTTFKPHHFPLEPGNIRGKGKVKPFYFRS